MIAKLSSYLYIFLTIALTVYGQIIFKWRMGMKGQMPAGVSSKFKYIFFAYLDPWIVSGFAAAFLASVTWSVALTRFQLSYAYPFTSLSFVLVFILSMLIFNEPFTWSRFIGIALICAGVIVIARGN